jgi:glyoxylase-like metal-dependent hydrolase (beta-lactamase superfamily II)
LIRHRDHGVILFDTGYAPNFFRATHRLPARLYRALLPATLPLQETLPAQLEALGLSMADVTRVVVSHFHGDHIAGLRDLPNARISVMASAVADFREHAGVQAIRHGFLPDLLPPDFDARYDAIEDEHAVGVPGLGPGYDLLGDRSLLAVPLAGHTAGHTGLLLTTNGSRVLLCGDAAWSRESWQQNCPPSRMARSFFSDPAASDVTLTGLQALAADNPSLVILPSHCQQSFEAWNRKGSHE